MDVNRASIEDLQLYYGLTAWVGRVEGQVVGVAGLVEADGRLWGFLDVRGKMRPLALVRALRDGIRETGRDVYIQCDDRRPHAHRLLTLVGFAPINEERAGMRVWKCRA